MHLSVFQDGFQDDSLRILKDISKNRGNCQVSKFLPSKHIFLVSLCNLYFALGILVGWIVKKKRPFR